MTANTLEQRALLPCPCGQPAKMYDVSGLVSKQGKKVVSCIDPECNWSMTGYGEDQVVTRWNRRDPQALRLSAGVDGPTFFGIPVVENRSMPHGTWVLVPNDVQKELDHE